VYEHERGRVLAGRFRYSDLKEAALSGAAGLWVFDRFGLVVAGGDAGFLLFGELVAWELVAADKCGPVA
jgi:hypothetical protein